PSPVMVLTPLLGEAATTSWPPWRRMATVFEPIRPVPPITTIFMVCPPLSFTGSLYVVRMHVRAMRPHMQTRAKICISFDRVIPTSGDPASSHHAPGRARITHHQG